MVATKCAAKTTPPSPSFDSGSTVLSRVQALQQLETKGQLAQVAAASHSLAPQNVCCQLVRAALLLAQQPGNHHCSIRPVQLLQATSDPRPIPLHIHIETISIIARILRVMRAPGARFAALLAVGFFLFCTQPAAAVIEYSHITR